MRLQLLFCVIIALAYCAVEFSHSTLYDVFDFIGAENETVHLTKCDNGCWIYASTMSDTFHDYPLHQDPFARHLLIYDNRKGVFLTDIADLSLWIEEDIRKRPLEIVGPATISVVNKNPEGSTPFTLAVHVIEKATAESISHAVYDVGDIGQIRPFFYSVFTFMSAQPWRLQADRGDTPSNVTVRLAGFDNGYDSVNRDNCPIVFQSRNSTTFTPFPGFVVQPNTPLVSLSIEGSIEIRLSFDYDHNRLLAEDGFITSPGWNGCRNPYSGGIQTFRSPFDQPTDSFLLSSDDNRNVALMVLPNLDMEHALEVTEVDGDTWFPTAVYYGHNAETNYFPQAKGFNISYSDLSGSQGFAALYYSDSPTVWTAPESYCNCEMKNSQPINWKPSEIWLDVVIIIDTSAAMASRLEEAKAMVTSFIPALNLHDWSDDDYYTRIGVVAASDKAEQIYFMNMTGTDNLNSIKSTDAPEMNFHLAFKEALKMFHYTQSRPRVRPVIYALTNSDAPANITGVPLFKQDGGIIIVNDFASTGASPLPSLESLATDNYFFTDLSQDFTANWGVLCEANCFCNPANAAYNDDAKSARTQANGGCYKAFNENMPQAGSRDMCHLKGYQGTGALVSIHDQQKEFFVNSVAATFGPKTKYWLGLQYNGSSWNWDDKSSNSFSDWDVNQPNTNGNKNQCAYAVQTTGLNVRWTAASCNEGHAYVCEMPPCSVGQKYC